ncbi:hypothetical protein HPB51_000810 [Rhipicephalus microplus]|uniref:Uncharacterized protein n=1 Tax=Rhipicephalus microplus TaxID=6941 RepID=A0A9J6EKT0_RHIMP|nr:hypothetical protein HPB51_000810 [Rhipicephalus microplus]
MRRRRVKETRFKTVSYQYPDSGQPRQHQENQTRRTVAQGVGVGNATDNTTKFSPGTHGNRQNSCENARANRCGVEVFKRLRSRAHAPPPSSSSSGECLLADKKNYNRRRRRNRTKKSLSEMSTLPLRKEFYGDGVTLQQRAFSSGDDGDNGSWFEKDNQPHMTQSNQGFTPMPLGGGNFWNDEDLELADRARHLSISSGSIFVSPQVQSTKPHSRTYQQTNFPDLQPCYKGRDGSRWSRGSDGRQVKRNVTHYAHGAKAMHDKCEEASETVFSGQRTSKERLLPVNGDPGVHFYDESDRFYCERRMVRRFQVKESPQEYSCESAADQDWRGTLADSINLPADPERTERWVHAHYPLVAQPLHAESAADPIFLFGEAATPPQREAQTLETRNRQAKRDTTCSNAKEMSQKVKSSAGAFVDTSSEDSSPPLDSKQHQFMPGSTSRNQRARMKSYESIIKEEKVKRAVTLSPTKKQSESQNNQACCDNTGRGSHANEYGFIDQRGPGTQFGHRTEWLFGQDSKSGYDQILVCDGSENCKPRKGRDTECQVYKRKEETMPPDDFDYMPRSHACSGARPKNTNEKVDPLPKLKSKMTRNIRLDHFHAAGRKNETCEGKRDQPIQNGSGDQTGWTEEFKLGTRSRVQTALRRNAEELDNEAKMQFYSCGEETLTKSSSHMTGSRETGRTERLRNETCQDKCNIYIENGRGDQRFSSAEPKHNSRQRTQAATFGNTGKLAYSGHEQKTEFYTCSSQSGSEAGEERSTDNWWSPTAHILPFMPQIKPQERQVP